MHEGEGEPLMTLERVLFLLLSTHESTQSDITMPPKHIVCKLGESSPKHDSDDTQIARLAVLTAKKTTSVV